MANEWYVRVGNVERGPIAPEMLRQLALTGKITPDMLLRKGTSGAWVPANRVKGLFPAGMVMKSPPLARPVARPPQPSPTRREQPAIPTVPPPSEPAFEAAPDGSPSGEDTVEMPVEAVERSEPAAVPVDEDPQPVVRKTATDEERRFFSSIWFQLVAIVLGLLGVFAIFVMVVMLATVLSRSADGLIGKWETDSLTDRVQFSSDGTAFVTKGGGQARATWKWLADGGIRIEAVPFNNFPPEIYQVTVNEEQLILKKPDGSEKTYSRVKK